MTANEAAIRKAIGRLADAYAPWTGHKTEVFWLALSDLWPEEVEAGVVTTLREWDQRFPPAPGYVRERALAHRSGKPPRSEGQRRGPVPWHEARTPLHQGEDGYMRDADDRYVLHPSERVPPRDESGVAEPWVAFMWTARTVAKLGAVAKPELVSFVELARAGADDEEFRALWLARRNTIAEGGMTPEEVNLRLMRVVAEAIRPPEAA